MLLPLSPLGMAVFAILFVAVTVVFVAAVIHSHSLWRQAREMMSWDWTNNPELQSRWLDFATPLLPWSLRRAYLLATVWLSAAIFTLALLTAAVSTSWQGFLFVGWCLIGAVIGSWNAVRIARSKHQSLPKT